MLKWPLFFLFSSCCVVQAESISQSANILKISASSASARAPLKGSKRAVAPLEAAPEPLSTEHLDVAEQVHQGKVLCELGAHVTITPNAKVAGHFDVAHGRERFVMIPVLTTTGAVRLEDARAGAVWLQLGNKSMLMNQKLGRRMADSCVSDKQRLVADALERAPVAGLLDPPTVRVANAQVVPESPNGLGATK